MFKKSKRLISVLLAVVMLLTAVPFTAVASSPNYPHTIFGLDSVSVNASGLNLNGSGKIVSGGSITVPSNFNQNNKLIENADEGMMYIGGKIESTYFSGGNVDIYDTDYEQSGTNINLNKAIRVNGNLSLNGGNINPASNLAIMATGNISLLCDTINANNNIIYSKQGNVEIEFPGTASLQGLIYAPHGNVTISAQGVNLNGVVIIAKNVTINSNQIVNVNYSDSIAAFVGVESEICDVCITGTIETCRYGGIIASPTTDGDETIRIPNGNALAGTSGSDATRRVLSIDILSIIKGTSIKANDIYGIEAVTWGQNTENRQMYIDVRTSGKEDYLEINGTEGTLLLPDPNFFHGPVKIFRKNVTEFMEIPLLYDFSENARGLGVADMARAIRLGIKARADASMCFHVLETAVRIIDAGEKQTYEKVESSFERPQAVPKDYTAELCVDEKLK